MCPRIIFCSGVYESEKPVDSIEKLTASSLPVIKAIQQQAFDFYKVTTNFY